MPRVKKVRRVAVVIDLDWPYKRHHEVFAGIHQYVHKRVGWKFILDSFAEHTLISKKSPKVKYDGIVGRVSLELALAAKSEGVPLVNVWNSSPAHDVPLVSPDFEAAGRMAAKHLLAKNTLGSIISYNNRA